MFVDAIHLLLQSGEGGKGCESYYRRTDHKMLPDGADGGDGGNVIIRADLNAPPLASLSFRQHQIAESGVNGGSGKKRGRNGADLILLVPPGTKILDRVHQFLIRELKEPGEEVVVLPGGKGGVGNVGGKQAMPGEKGKALDVELQIRLQADVFLIGLPNAGKSSLMNKLTRTHLKEEAYPFTTAFPEIGVYETSAYEQIRLCELPSLYAASGEGRGRGNTFLKHLEGAAFVFYVLAPETGFASNLSEGWEILRKQMELYHSAYLKIPYGIIVNKVELLSSAEKKQFSSRHPRVPKFFISVATGEGMDDLTDFLDNKLKSVMRETSAS